MSAAVRALGVLAAAVHVLDPVKRIPLVLRPGAEVTDRAIAEQITNPRCWLDRQFPMPGEVRKSARKAKPAQD